VAEYAALFRRTSIGFKMTQDEEMSDVEADADRGRALFGFRF
jgi:hypothetical protein